MFKELILAIIFGGLIGFGATGTFIAFKKKDISVTNNAITTQIDDSPTSTQAQISPTIAPTKNTLNIFQPQNNSVVSDSKLILKGQTDNSAIIVITTVDNSYTINADSSGNFDTTINLNPGINHLKITTISPTDAENNTELFVTYTTAKI
ncbi:MAG: hypothetical protein WC069_01045 [Candidatus Shapirobacteria bacterium]